MDSPLARIADMGSVAVDAEAPPPPAGDGGEPFEALYQRLLPRIYGYVASLLRDSAAAEDVTALAFERAYRRWRSYRPARGSAESWLFGIARNAALDELRRRARRSAVEIEVADLEPESWRHVEEGVRRAAVRALAPRERELVALKFAGELSNAEIARVLGISESNAGTRLYRTIEKLREACHEDA
jgi:RNA polymerase sigma-70 factor (ECF subfamily)